MIILKSSIIMILPKLEKKNDDVEDDCYNKIDNLNSRLN